MAGSAIAVALLGRQAEMGRLVTKALYPEIEVVHFLSTPEAAKQELPLLLEGRPPSSPSHGAIGTQDYSRPVEAVLLGLGYTNDVVHELRQACKSISPGVPWLTGGLGKDELAKLFRNSPMPSPQEQAPITGAKVKCALMKLLEEGGGGKDGLYSWYED